jgi:hypothetical protein
MPAWRAQLSISAGFDALGHHADGVVDEGADEAAGEEAARIVDDDRRLLQLGDEVQRLRQRGVAGGLAADHLHQRHLVGWREEVQADETIGPRGWPGPAA